MSNHHFRGLIWFSIAAALITMAMKSTAYFLTGSISLFSDALESCINLLAAVAALFSLWYAARPVDATHTYGHEKIEYFSSGLEGALIIVAGGGIIWTAVRRLIVREPLEAIGVGTLIALLASFVNLAVARILLHAGKKHQSIILEADGQHLMSDVWTSIAVVGGLMVVWMTGWEILDPIIAIAVALNIAWTGINLIRRSFDGLMDHALPAAEQEAFRQAVLSQLPAGTNFHALRTRQAGARRFADFHLLVPGNMSVQDGHDLAQRIEVALRSLFSTLEVTIHIEPIEAKEAWSDNVLEGIEPVNPTRSEVS
jgi:cation diffusion facilitator family transporter